MIKFCIPILWIIRDWILPNRVILRFRYFPWNYSYADHAGCPPFWMTSESISNAGSNQDVFKELVKSEYQSPVYSTIYLTMDFHLRVFPLKLFLCGPRWLSAILNDKRVDLQCWIKPGRVQWARQIGGSIARIFNNLFNEGFLLQLQTFPIDHHRLHLRRGLLQT